MSLRVSLCTNNVCTHKKTPKKQNHSQPCLNRKRCQVPFPGWFDICPCGERSPCSACPQRTPISLSPGHGRGPCHKTHPPAGSTASPALWFAVNRGTFREGSREGGERGGANREKVDERKKELGIMCCLVDTIASSLTHNNSDTAKRTMKCPWKWASQRSGGLTERAQHDNQITTERITTSRNYFLLLRRKTRKHKTCTYLCCDLEVFVLFQQLLRVVNARPSGRVRGQVELPGVMDPLQGLAKRPIMRDDTEIPDSLRVQL